MMYVEDVESGIWPAHTDELCRWDMHPFIGTPIGMPLTFDARTDKILMQGYWCSFACLIAWCNETMQANVMQLREYRRHIARIALDFYGEHVTESRLRPAPPREKLSFLRAKYKREGHATPDEAALAEFRGDSQFKLYHPHPPAPFVRVTQAIDEEERVREQEEQHRNRVDLMTQDPTPIACTTRGQIEQRKYVLSKQQGGAHRPRGAIDQLMNILYVDADAAISSSSASASYSPSSCVTDQHK